MGDEYHSKLQETLSYEAIINALFENYESIYVVDIQTSAYQCFHESDSFSMLRLENSGENFFVDLKRNILKTIYPEDQKYVGDMLTKDALLAGLEQEKYYTFVYRLMIDGKPLYHKLRATRDMVNRRPHFLIGVRNIDAAYRLDQAHTEEISAMHRKEKNHLEAILASAAGYLEVNLSKDRIYETSPRFSPQEVYAGEGDPAPDDPLAYGAFERWMVRNRVVEDREKYAEISDRDYLIKCYERGEKRATVSFAFRSADGHVRPCRKVFYLYSDESNGDILAFCVIYDLTERQRKEKELRDLENELQMSRIRNFTSQMQPHFLYNALGSIQEIVLDDPEYASELLGDFAIHLRSCIRAATSDAPVPFGQELANIRAYVNIEKMRFGDKLRVCYDVRTQDFSILPLSVQPLVENAIRHGIYERGAGGGTVTIRTEEGSDAWRVFVEDDGVGFDTDAFWQSLAEGRRDSAGLKNILFRLDKVMGATVDIASRIGVGTTVTITIPKEKA